MADELTNLILKRSISGVCRGILVVQVLLERELGAFYFSERKNDSRASEQNGRMEGGGGLIQLLRN